MKELDTRMLAKAARIVFHTQRRDTVSLLRVLGTLTGADFARIAARYPQIDVRAVAECLDSEPGEASAKETIRGE